MTTNENNKSHRKHAQLVRPDLGHFNRVELAILGTPCSKIKKLAFSLIQALAVELKIAYVDADHPAGDAEMANGPDLTTALGQGAALEFTDKITYHRLDYRTARAGFEQKLAFREADLVLVNGNHFPAQAQIIVIDPAKPLEKKLNKLTNVQLILLAEGVTEIPEFLNGFLGETAGIPVFRLEETGKIAAWVTGFRGTKVPSLLGLVLAGGRSTRMQQDKGALQYHGTDQRRHVLGLLRPYCDEVFVSCNAEQARVLGDSLPVLEDRFLQLGPKGGILTALQHNPNAAWLAVACDLPFLSADTLAYLVQHRDPTKMATAFYDSDGRFPEPLLTIWEPRSYGSLLQFLSLGYSCPRKALINSDICLLTIPDSRELRNVNDPESFKQSLKDLGKEI